MLESLGEKQVEYRGQTYINAKQSSHMEKLAIWRAWSHSSHERVLMERFPETVAKSCKGLYGSYNVMREIAKIIR